MKYIAFVLDTKYSIWMYEDIQIQEIDKQRWILIIDNESRIYESIYDVIHELAVRGFHSTFRLPKELEYVNPMDKCE